MDNEQLMQIYDGAMNVFCQGIYVPCDMHPCGWDFISFENIEDSEDDILTYIFIDDDINDGNYSIHPYEGLTLKQILDKTEGRFAFEIGQINWC